MWKDKKVLVLGAGKSGLSAARFLRERGAVVGVYDDNRGHSIKDAIFVQDVEFEQFDWCVISPGVSKSHPIAKMFDGKIFTELSLLQAKRSVGITGTNGKTTVTKLVAGACGVVPIGNIGVPVSSRGRQKLAVVEVSSFMTELDCPAFDIGVILNMSEDHLERHGDIQEYIRCKKKLIENSRIGILNYDCEICRDLGDENTLWFSKESVTNGAYVAGGNIFFRGKKIFPLSVFNEDRPHMVENILAMVLICKLLKISNSRIVRAYRDQEAPKHRIEHVGNVDNVMFYNDSKATNIASCLAACRVFKLPINLIVGGQVKGQDFSKLFKNLPGNIEQVFVYGSDKETILKHGGIECRDLGHAVEMAFGHGTGPRIVLLSPACASLDEFKSYADRGEQFVRIIQSLEK